MDDFNSNQPADDTAPNDQDFSEPPQEIDSGIDASQPDSTVESAIEPFTVNLGVERTYPPEETWEYCIGNNVKPEMEFLEQMKESEKTYDLMRSASIEMDPTAAPVDTFLDMVDFHQRATDHTPVMGEGFDSFLGSLPEPYTDPYPAPETDPPAPSNPAAPPDQPDES